jgi:glutamine synthetase
MDGGIKAACYYRDEVDARRQKASALINQLETITSAQHWPFPSYADILFSV